MTDKQVLKSIKALAKDECANYMSGMCLLTDQECHLINPNYDSIHDGAIDCDYFLECVLPENWEMKDLVYYALWYDEENSDELPSDMKRCEVCQQAYIPTHAKQKYCKNCAEAVNRQKTRDRMYLMRQSK